MSAEAGRAWALPAALRRTVQLSSYGDLAPVFRAANIPVLRGCLQAAPLWAEVGMLERLLYKNAHQHRGSHFMRYLQEARRTLSQLRGLQLPQLLDDLHFLLQRGGAAGPVGPLSTAEAAGGGAPPPGLLGRASKAACSVGAGRGGSSGRKSYQLPSKEGLEAVLSHLIAGTALVRGLQVPLHAASAHLSAQLALTYFVPLATTALAMLARIK
ncbi:hypothetical protein TSOC_007952, partial [Tetrabaena socialis]